MLTIRDAQMRFLMEARIHTLRGDVTRWLWDMRSEFSPKLERPALEGLVAFSIERCLSCGFLEERTIYDFALAMVKDDEFPIPADRIQQKSTAVVQEMRARALLAQLQAVEASIPQTGPTNTDQTSGSDRPS
jgi:hypothetical protein